MIHDRNQSFPTNYQPQQMMVCPVFIIFDASWLDTVAPQHSNWFFQKFPPRQIIEVISSVPTDVDYDGAFWAHIEAIFNDDELTNYDFASIDLVVEQLVLEFYERLNELAPNLDQCYIFREWLDNNSLVLVREDKLSL